MPALAWPPSSFCSCSLEKAVGDGSSLAARNCDAFVGYSGEENIRERGNVVAVSPKGAQVLSIIIAPLVPKGEKISAIAIEVFILKRLQVVVARLLRKVAELSHRREA